MQKIDSILVIVDRNEDRHPEIERAAELALILKATVHLFVREFNASLYLHYAISQRGDKLSREAYEREAQYWADQQVKSLEEKGITASAEASWERHMYSAAMEQINRISPDLVIKATHHDSRLHRTLFNYTDWELMRNCKQPLLLVKQGNARRNDAILCAVNPGHANIDHVLLDEKIMAAGNFFSERLQQPIHVFNCLELPPETLPAIARMDTSMFDHHRQDIESRHREIFDNFIKNYNLPSESVHQLNGVPEDLLAELAESLPASMVIMGAVSRTAMPTLLIGHTAERVLDRLDCDILILKHPAVAEYD